MAQEELKEMILIGAEISFSGRIEAVARLSDCTMFGVWEEEGACPTDRLDLALCPTSMPSDSPMTPEPWLGPRIISRFDFEAAFFTVRSVFFPTPSLSLNEPLHLRVLAYARCLISKGFF